MTNYTAKEIYEFKKAGLTKQQVDAIKTRAIDGNGKVYYGDAGRNLLRRQQEEIRAKESKNRGLYGD